MSLLTLQIGVSPSCHALPLLYGAPYFVASNLEGDV